MAAWFHENLCLQIASALLKLLRSTSGISLDGLQELIGALANDCPASSKNILDTTVGIAVDAIRPSQLQGKSIQAARREYSTVFCFRPVAAGYLQQPCLSQWGF
jgi:hypothetical protein